MVLFGHSSSFHRKFMRIKVKEDVLVVQDHFAECQNSTYELRKWSLTENRLAMVQVRVQVIVEGEEGE
jgi:hypothetical protein